MTDEQVIANRDHIEFMDRPHLWVAGQGFICPLKKPGKIFELGGTGYLVAGHGFEVTVGLMGVPLTTDTKIQYDSAVEVAADGWEVD